VIAPVSTIDPFKKFQQLEIQRKAIKLQKETELKILAGEGVGVSGAGLSVLDIENVKRLESRILELEGLLKAKGILLFNHF
jgi:hypothetical protein